VCEYHLVYWVATVVFRLSVSHFMVKMKFVLSLLQTITR